MMVENNYYYVYAHSPEFYKEAALNPKAKKGLAGMVTAAMLATGLGQATSSYQQSANKTSIKKSVQQTNVARNMAGKPSLKTKG
jgi:hypothetical protein